MVYPGVLIICAPINGQRIDVVRGKFPFLKSLEFSDMKGGDEINVLIGADGH